MRQKTGRMGEEAAARFLADKGYEILERNWRCRKDEIDIIARDGDWLVIVEVKTYAGAEWISPGEAVPKTKQRCLIRAANAYIERKDIHMEIRFDIISVVLAETGTQINHIPDAFYPLL
ncbi:MAG: YraN family protein [Bacteroidales bacterium]|nr:YraN family protein [Bacteroidales bacterium]